MQHFFQQSWKTFCIVFCVIFQIFKKIFYKITNLSYMNFYRNLVTWSGWSMALRGEIPLELLKKAVFFNFIPGEWKRSKSGFFAYIRRHYLTSKKQFFYDRKIQNGGNMTDPVDSVAATIFCGRQLPSWLGFSSETIKENFL